MLLFILSLFVLKHIAVWWAANKRLTQQYLARQLETSVAVVLLYGLFGLSVIYFSNDTTSPIIPFKEFVIFLAIDLFFVLSGLPIRNFIVKIVEKIDFSTADSDFVIHRRFADSLVLGLHSWSIAMWAATLFYFL